MTYLIKEEVQQGRGCLKPPSEPVVLTTYDSIMHHSCVFHLVGIHPAGDCSSVVGASEFILVKVLPPAFEVAFIGANITSNGITSAVNLNN